VGTLIYQPHTGGFQVRKGPVFAHIVLADEINRAPAKVQSALLEAMQEGQVTIGEASFPLPQPFLVLATQNPLEHEGTYPLPEAQVDRFLFKLLVGYPSRTEERGILDRMTDGPEPTANPVLDPARVLSARAEVRAMHVDERIKKNVLDLMAATRAPASIGLKDLETLVQFGASPRAGIHLLKADKANAFLAGRAYLLPQDVN